MAAIVDLVIPQPNSLLGIDVSSHQHPNGEPINWQLVADSGIMWTYIKEGEDRKTQQDAEGPPYNYYVNPYFEQDVIEALAAGLRVGVYRYVRPTGTPPAESVTRMEASVGALGGLRRGMFAVCDFEEPHGDNQLVWLSEFLSTVAGSPMLCKGHKAASWLYSSRLFLDMHDCLVPGSTPTTFPYIHAHYSNSRPVDPEHYKIRAWQFTAKGYVPGVQGACDVNTFFGTLSDFDKLCLP